MNLAQLIKRPGAALWLAAVTAALAVAGCGSGSAADQLNGPPVSGPHETVTLTFWFSGPEYEQADAGSACVAPASQSMFAKGASVAAKDADNPENSVGFASLPAGFISRSNVGRCAFMVNMQIGLGPSKYQFKVGSNDNTFTVTGDQQAIVKLGSHGVVQGVDVNITAKQE